MLYYEAMLPAHMEAELRRIGIIDTHEVEVPSGGCTTDEIKRLEAEFDEFGEPNF